MRLSIAAILFAAMGIGIGMPITDTTMPNNTATQLQGALKNLTTDEPYENGSLGPGEGLVLMQQKLDNDAGLVRGLDDEFDLGLVDPEASHIVTRAETGPPRNRKVAEQMKSLPECYQTCFRKENGKVGVNIYEWDLDKFCWYPTWIRTNTWILYHIRPCWERECKKHKHEIKGAGRRWMKETCPRYK